jgi:putative heme-binding domain-containing protein
LPTAEALATAKDGRAFPLLKAIVNDADIDLQVRRQAVRGLARLKNGAQELLALAGTKKLDATLREAAAAGLHQAEWADIKSQAASLFPLPASKNATALPPVSELVKLTGNAKRGADIFKNAGTCAKCHIVNKEGKEVGPDLSEIGDKLSREALFESILFPSAAISHNYESYLVVLANGTVATGLLVSETPEATTIKDAEAIVRSCKKSEVEEMKKQPVSLMPADLLKTMSQQDLVDVVSYLMTLRKGNAAKSAQRPAASGTLQGDLQSVSAWAVNWNPGVSKTWPALHRPK